MKNSMKVLDNILSDAEIKAVTKKEGHEDGTEEKERKTLPRKMSQAFCVELVLHHKRTSHSIALQYLLLS